MTIDVSTLGADPIDGESYVLQITSVKAKASKAKNIMLRISADIVSGDAVGYTVWHQVMLVDSEQDNKRTRQWVARAVRDLRAMGGFEITQLPSKADEETSDTRNLVGKTFQAVLKLQTSEDYDDKFVIKRVLGPVDPEALANLDTGFEIVDEDALVSAAEEGAVL